MVTRYWTRNDGLYQPDGSTPLVQQSLMVGQWSGGPTLLRIRTDIQFTVSAVATATGDLVNFRLLTGVSVAMGMVLYDTATPPASAPAPFLDENGTGAASGWLQWEFMYPEVSVFHEADLETAVVTYQSHNGTIDTQSRRRTTVGNQPSLWLSWEIVDTSNQINQEVDGVFYALGMQYTTGWLVESLS